MSVLNFTLSVDFHKCVIYFKIVHSHVSPDKYTLQNVHGAFLLLPHAGVKVSGYKLGPCKLRYMTNPAFCLD